MRALIVWHSPWLVWAGVAVGAGGLTLLWWTSTLPPTSFGAQLTEAGRLTGLFAGYLVVILLVLMARLPLLERQVGTDRLARIHSMVGRYVVCVTVAHMVLIWLGYALTAHASLGAEVTDLLTGYPYVLWAVIGAGLFVLVGTVSATAIRSRVRYETWYLLHLLTYAGIALAFWHQILTGAQFVPNAVARWGWIGAYAAATALLVWYRLLVPIRNVWRHRLEVAAVRTEAPGVVSIYLTGARLDELGAEAGQFLRLRFLTRNAWWQSHPYSLSAAPNPSWLRVTIKALGDHTEQLQRIRVGTRVLAEGPYGALTARRRSRHGVVLIAGGVGVTPLRALFESLPAEEGRLTLIYRASRHEDVVFRHELDEIAADRRAVVHYLVGPPGPGQEPALHPNWLRRLVPDVAERDAYLCGPGGMMTTAMESLRECGVPARRIHHEDFNF
ncbi:ferredoxin reductase family protein [Actinopolymorpha singaporensis]